ncbi:MAG: hypothetical protein QM772_17295 [Ottowia sp.]|uniref:hypothetical protein n=1 Tax=Ottowia sp. TaxID=1898956 RepID=UPI0039E32024
MSLRTIEIFRLRRVRDKPRALAVMQAFAGLGADAARHALDQAIGGGKPRLQLPDDEAARACIAALAPAGFIARFAAAADFDAQARAEAAILAVVHRLPSEVGDGAGALLLAGDWQAALAMCVQAAHAGGAGGGGAGRLLREAALEAGVQPGVQGNG